METEKTIYQLEAYLDGALQPEAAEALADRLQREPSLQKLADELRTQRALRSHVWASLEGTASEAEAVATRFAAAARQWETSERRWRSLRWISAAAAVILLGFGIGWTGRALMHSPVMPGSIVTSEEGGYRVAVTDTDGNIIAVQQFGTIDDAQRFSQELQDWQDRRQRLTEGQILLVGDRF